MPSGVRGRSRVVFRISDRALWGDQRADARAVGFTNLDAVKRNQRPLAERDFRSGAARIPYRTGRLRRSLEFQATSSGVSVVSNLVYYFQAEDAVAAWWRRTGRRRFQRALHNAIREFETTSRRRDRERRRGADEAEVAALERGDETERRRLRRNRLARENRRRSPEERAKRAMTRSEQAQFRRDEVRREVQAARARRDERIGQLQERYRQRHTRRRSLLPAYRQSEFPLAARLTRTGRTRTPRGEPLRQGGRYEERARRLLTVMRASADQAAEAVRQPPPLPSSLSSTPVGRRLAAGEEVRYSDIGEQSLEVADEAADIHYAHRIRPEPRGLVEYGGARDQAYVEFTANLRGGRPLNDRQKRMLADIESVTTDLPDDIRNRPLFRGMQLDDDALAVYEPGASITLDSPTSTSMTESTARIFAEYGGSGADEVADVARQAILHIYSGDGVRGVVWNQHEAEVLMEMGTRLDIVANVRDDEGRSHVIAVARSTDTRNDRQRRRR